MSSPLGLGCGPGRVLDSWSQALDFEDGGWRWLGSGRWALELALGSGSAPSWGDPGPLTPTPLPGKAAGAAGSIPETGKFPGVGNGNPLQYSCLRNSMDRGAWWATVHGVAKESGMTK